MDRGSRGVNIGEGRNYLYDLNTHPEEVLNLYNSPREASHSRFRHYPSQHHDIECLVRQLGDMARQTA